MNLIAELVLTPGGIIAWIVVGLIAGWLAGVMMSGGGYGLVRDTLLGLVGGFDRRFRDGAFFVQGDAGFWGSIVVAFIGACILVGIVRMMSPGRLPKM